MSDNNVRAWVLENLDLPEEWLKIPEQRIPRQIDRTTVFVKHDKIRPHTAAPHEHLENDVVVAILSHHQDIARMEDDLDEQILHLLHSIPQTNMIWTDAQKVVTPDGKYGGWEINLTVISRRPKLNQ